MVEPELAKMIDLSKKLAGIIQEVRDTPTLYDALIDDFEPNMTQTTIDRVFTAMAKKLVPLAEKCIIPSKDLDASVLRRKVPIEAQRQIATFLGDFVQYDTTSPEAGGRIDETEHPFTSGYFDDVRITTHYYEDNIASAIYSVLHELGHAIYGQGHPQGFKWRAIGDASSYGIHESQSRFIENMIGRSPEFISFFYPHLNKFTNNVFKDIAIEDFIRIVNRVERSKIRIESDEVTYSLHIIIRFDIERDLFADKISVTDLPQVWIDKYDEYLNVSIDNDAEGAMQDTHHFSGYFGYFPSYALGNIYGGQFLQTMIKDHPDWLDQIGRGEFSKVKQWMVDHIHQKGNLYDPEDLVHHVTGEKLNSQPFMDYLEAKYSKIFNL
jgi:carboxypeptidase Taq